MKAPICWVAQSTEKTRPAGKWFASILPVGRDQPNKAESIGKSQWIDLLLFRS
jgi:hypothetical protein